VKANLLDDGSVDTLVLVGATIALHEIPWPHELVWRNTRETSNIRAVYQCEDTLVLNHGIERSTQELLLARGTRVLTLGADRHQRMMDGRP